MIWKEAVGFPQYEVSDTGLIRLKRTGRLRKIWLNKDGYVYLCLMREGRKKTVLLHIVIAQTFIGLAPSPSHTVDHDDRVRSNNAVGNLKWSTRTEQARNVKLPPSPLNLESYKEIIRLGRQKARHTEIARQFGVSRSVIWQILNGNVRHDHRHLLDEALRIAI